MSANDRQVGGTHYKRNEIQPWDYIVANNMGWLEGNIVKYITRWESKGGMADLEKVKHYLEKLMENQRTDQQQAELRSHEQEWELHSSYSEEYPEIDPMTSERIRAEAAEREVERLRAGLRKLARSIDYSDPPMAKFAQSLLAGWVEDGFQG